MTRTITLTWDEDRKTGKGMLYARDDNGNAVAAPMPWDGDPIVNHKDPDSIAWQWLQTNPQDGECIQIEKDGEYLTIIVESAHD